MEKKVIAETENANVVTDAVDVELKPEDAVVDAIVDDDDDADDNGLSFDSIEDDDADDAAERSRDEIIADILSDKKHTKLFTGLRIKSVANSRNADALADANAHSFLTFVLKDKVFGMIATDELDALNRPVLKLGYTKNVTVSSYAVSGTMKEDAETAIFAYDAVRNPDVCNTLFAGGTLDVIAHLVPAGVEYINPFASNPTPTVFDADKVLYYIVNLQFGPIGLRKLEAYINK